MKIYNMPRGTGKTRYLANLNMPIVVATKAMKNEAELQGAKDVYTVKEFLKLEKSLQWYAWISQTQYQEDCQIAMLIQLLLQKGDNFGLQRSNRKTNTEEAQEN